MFSKLGAYLNLLRKGQEVADPEKWKTRQITGTIIGALILALIRVAEAHGYEIPISATDAETIGGTVIIIANLVLTATTSKRAGLLPTKSDVGREPVVSEEPPKQLSEESVVESKPGDVQTKANSDKKDDFDQSIYFG